jgi:hypothetical protein
MQCHFFPTHSNITVLGLDEGVFVNATLFPSITGISQLFVNGLQAPPEVYVQNGDINRRTLFECATTPNIGEQNPSKNSMCISI